MENLLPFFIHTAISGYLIWRKKTTEADHLLAFIVTVTYPLTVNLEWIP
jgi:tryptophan-rich sensory protein